MQTVHQIEVITKGSKVFQKHCYWKNEKSENVGKLRHGESSLKHPWSRFSIIAMIESLKNISHNVIFSWKALTVKNSRKFWENGLNKINWSNFDLTLSGMEFSSDMWHFVKCTLVISVIIRFSSVIFLHLLTRVITCQSLTFKSFISNFWIFSVKLFTKKVIDSLERWVCLRLSSLRTGQYLIIFWIDSKLIGAIEPVLSPKSRKYYLID